MSGSAIVPVVGKTEVEGEPAPQPHFHGNAGRAAVSNSGSAAPSVPTEGFLFRARPIDEHYQSEMQPKGNPYKTVGRPGTLGWWTRVQQFANGIATSQDVDNVGFKVRHPQQRTSVMRNQLPPKGEFGTQTYIPTPSPQAVRYNRIVPVTGTDQYGTGVLNSDTFGAGQTAGGIGGSNYTTPAAAPVQTQVTPAMNSDMPVWG